MSRFSADVILLALLFSYGNHRAATLPAPARYRVALPGYKYEFPRDNFNHPDFQTEWWYYTGNVTAADGHRFGFELTFFRRGVAGNSSPCAGVWPCGRNSKAQAQDSQSSARGQSSKASDWLIHDIYLAHFAVSDLDGRRYFHTERLNRAGPGLAGADLSQARIWNGNWQVRWHGNRQELEAVAERFTIRLALESLKPPVIHGRNGVSQKAAGAGRASYYISLTRLAAKGTIVVGQQTCEVSGTAWMDHEFFTEQLDPAEAGWDWIGLQLDDGSELMLYRLRRKDGTVDPYSAGTWIDPTGRSFYIGLSEFSFDPDAQTWRSPETHATYPLRWRVKLGSPEMQLVLTTPLEKQEFTSAKRMFPTYWEGAVQVEGRRGSAAIRGVGYLEMTGYARPLDVSE